MDKEQKVKEIRKRKNKLKKIIKNIGDSKKELVEKLIEEAAFMSATLQELRDIINEEGAVKLVKNGNGIESLQEHPAQKSYNAMIKNYNSTIKTITDMVDLDAEAADELEAFMRSGRR